MCVQCTKQRVKCRVAGTGVSNRPDKAKRIADEKAMVDKAKPVAGPSGVAKKGAQAREGDHEVVHSVSASGSLSSDADSAQ